MPARSPSPRTVTAVGVLIAGTAIGAADGTRCSGTSSTWSCEGGARTRYPCRWFCSSRSRWRAAAPPRSGSALVARLRRDRTGRSARAVRRAGAADCRSNSVEQAGSGDLISRVTGDVTMIAKAVRQALPELVPLAAHHRADPGRAGGARLALPARGAAARCPCRRTPCAGTCAGPPRCTRSSGSPPARSSSSCWTRIGGARTVRAFRLERGHTWTAGSGRSLGGGRPDAARRPRW